MLIGNMVPIIIGRHVVVEANGSNSITAAIGMPISMSMSTTIGDCSRSVAAA
ncbi:hypothetical protein RX330_10640 [Bradyrhizobium sp. NDS-1]|uniref:hypothetical protein n=1 Tax=Bradyrhizobium sp. NDS-1 TaxID=3080014 RepID=UPI00293EC4CC|nr:hypothetical protein [Bradyrhizobium sp. NDS-1]WOH75522.1 hypothetical protein RX330_10640 [Bradyrhizobium sp. NDS-1]